MMIANPLAKRSARAPDLQVKGKKYAHKKAVTAFLARAATRLLQPVGIVTTITERGIPILSVYHGLMTALAFRTKKGYTRLSPKRLPALPL